MATEQPPCGGMGMGWNRGGGMQTGLALRLAVSLLSDARIEKVALDIECDGSARGKS